MPDEDFNIYGDDETFGLPAEVRVLWLYDTFPSG
jgi:hypothetical protein